MAKKKWRIYGTCPTCKGIGFHRKKKSGMIYLEGNTKAKCSRFKCKYCGSWFGFFDQKDWENANEEEAESETEDWKRINTLADNITLIDIHGADNRDYILEIREIAEKHCGKQDS